MRKFFCDVCGAEIEPGCQLGDNQSASTEIEEAQKDMPSLAQQVCPNVIHLCSICREAGENLNVSELIHDSWIKCAKNSKNHHLIHGSESFNDTDGSVKSERGSHWRIKRELYDRLKSYRKKHGIECITEISKLSGLDRDTLHSMMQMGSHSIDEWKQLEKALDALESEGSEEAS